jgi:AAA family ATP:ADP antiporter
MQDMQAENSTDPSRLDCVGRYPALRTLGIRATFLFINFFLIIMALYQLKPASRSLFIEAVGSRSLPYVWIATAMTMAVLISFYHRLVERYSRLNVVLGSCMLFSGLLIAFRLGFRYPHPAIAVGLYVFVDILSVVLVEQFWSLTNSIYTTRQGRSWYGVVGTGGLVGGVLGGWVAAMLIRHTALQTPDLLVTAAGIIGLIIVLTWVMSRVGIFCEVDHALRPKMAGNGWRVLRRSRYLLLIAAILLLAQLASPIVEYQFLSTVESVYTELEARTAFLSMFFSVLGLVSIAVNLGLTSLIHRKLGCIAGLLVQPLMISLFSWCFYFQGTLFFGAAAKISDRGLSYSINRASKELLYVPIDPVLIYQAKAWIDMFGYRLFKVAGSVIILVFTQWLPIAINVKQLSWFTIGICGIWVCLIFVLRQDYYLMCGDQAE